MATPAAASISSVRPTGTIFELEALEGLPCGCVEAKGPHCILAGHTSGQILRLGDPSEFEDNDEEE